METIDFIKEVETTYDVSSIKVNNIEVWGFLRSIYSSEYFNKQLNLIGSKKTQFNAKIEKFKNAFYGIRNIFRRYEFLIFSDTMELKLVDGAYINKIVDYLIKQLDPKKVLLIENPESKSHFSLSQLFFKQVISLDLFRCLCYFNFIKKKIKIHNEWILKDINSSHYLEIDYNKNIFKFLCYYKIFKLFFLIQRPKLIFITSYYGLTYQAAIYAAKQLNITVTEIQHGLITKKNPPYNVFLDLDKKMFPDYLLVLGPRVKEIFDQENKFIEKDNVIPIGSMYIDYLNNRYNNEIEEKLFNDMKVRYKKTVVVSSQYTIENRLVEFLINSSFLDKSILYILVPRGIEKENINCILPSNFIIILDIDIYQLIKLSDFHATVYSTCALEAPALGVPNIMINIDNLSINYYKEILNNPNTTRYVNKEEEFVNLIKKWRKKDHEKIKILHEVNLTQNYKDNFKRALEIIQREAH